MNTPLKRSVVDNTLDRNKEPLPSVWPERHDGGCEMIAAALISDRGLAL